MKILLLTFILSFVAGQRYSCTPGEPFFDKCNYCKCSLNGTSAACTRMLCPPGQYDSNGNLIPENKYQNRQCVPGTIFKRDCNTCTCTGNGLALCTLMACPSIHTSKEQSKSISDGKKCVPGTTFKRDCNTCTCTKDGRAVCTLMLCPSISSAEQSDSNEINCTPGSTFKKDCNNCICAKNGKSAACTLMACPQGNNSDINSYLIRPICIGNAC